MGEQNMRAGIEMKGRTVVIAPTIAMIRPAIADMTALIPRPMAEKIEP